MRYSIILLEKLKKTILMSRFFFPVGDHSEYDKNPSWKNEEYRILICRMAEKYETGLHPSFYAAGRFFMVKSGNRFA